MTEATGPGKASFGGRWAIPIVLGAAAGVPGTVLLLDGLVPRIGEVPGGAVSALAGIGLGVALAVAVALLGRLVRRATLAGPGPAADRQGG